MNYKFKKSILATTVASVLALVGCSNGNGGMIVMKMQRILSFL